MAETAPLASRSRIAQVFAGDNLARSARNKLTMPCAKLTGVGLILHGSTRNALVLVRLIIGMKPLTGMGAAWLSFNGKMAHAESPRQADHLRGTAGNPGVSAGLRTRPQPCPPVREKCLVPTAGFEHGCLVITLHLLCQMS